MHLIDEWLLQLKEEAARMFLTPACCVCGRSDDDALDAMVSYGFEMRRVGLAAFPICRACACIVANVFNFRHSGEYLMAGAEPWLSHSAAPPKKRSRSKVSAKQALRVFKRDGYRCKACPSSEDLTVDHITPSSKGGGGTDDNLQTLCRACNASKNNRADWTGRKGQ